MFLQRILKGDLVEFKKWFETIPEELSGFHTPLTPYHVNVDVLFIIDNIIINIKLQFQIYLYCPL